MASSGGEAQRAERMLAYEHQIAVEITKDLLAARVRDVQRLCAADAQAGCTILDVAVSTGEQVPHGSIRMRLAPTGVEGIVEAAARGGRVTSRTTHAEDLADAVADTERELALLSLHRDRLTEFMKSKELKIEQHITVSRELASVQTQIDELSTRRATLRRRIDTELLAIAFSVPVEQVVDDHSYVGDALKSFGDEFREALGNVIIFVAWLLPWLVVIVPSIFLLRLLWRWITRWLARRVPVAR